MHKLDYRCAATQSRLLKAPLQSSFTKTWQQQGQPVPLRVPDNRWQSSVACNSRAYGPSLQPTCLRACGLQAPLHGRLLALQDSPGSSRHRSCQGHEEVPSRSPCVCRGIVQRCVDGCVQAAAELGQPPGLQAGQGLRWQGSASGSRRVIRLGAPGGVQALLVHVATNRRRKALGSAVVEIVAAGQRLAASCAGCCAAWHTGSLFCGGHRACFRGRNTRIAHRALVLAFQTAAKLVAANLREQPAAVAPQLGASVLQQPGAEGLQEGWGGARGCQHSGAVLCGLSHDLA